MIAFVTPGQGAEFPGMGRELVERHAIARRVVDEASAACGIDLHAAAVGRDRSLLLTSVAQPAVAGLALATEAVLREGGVVPAFALGYSAGEITALATAGVVTAATATRLARRRGELMQAEAARVGGGMLSFAADDASAIEAALALGRAHGAFDRANDVAVDHPDSGTTARALFTGAEAALRAVMARFGGTRLTVGGPWHSPSMVGAVEPFRAALDATPMRSPDVHLILADQAACVADAEAIRAALAGQIVRPMRIRASLELALASGVTDLVILGPSRFLRVVLRAFVGARARVHVTESMREVDRTIEELGA